MSNDGRQEIPLGDAAKQLGVTRPTLYYYIKRLKIETVKYQLDKKTYMSLTDFERIKVLKAQARQRSSAEKEENAA